VQLPSAHFVRGFDGRRWQLLIICLGARKCRLCRGRKLAPGEQDALPHSEDGIKTDSLHCRDLVLKTLKFKINQFFLTKWFCFGFCNRLESS